MPNASLPADIGVAEVRSIFNQLEKEASNREKELMDAARQIMLDEELLDALYIQYEHLDTDFRRAEYAAESTLEKLNLFRERNEEIVGEVTAVETELPLLSSSIKRFPASKEALSVQDIYKHLELVSQKQAFLLEGVRRLEESSDLEFSSGEGDETSRGRASLEKPKIPPVDPVLLQISEGKVLQRNLEWELTDIEDKLRSLDGK